MDMCWLKYTQFLIAIWCVPPWASSQPLHATLNDRGQIIIAEADNASLAQAHRRSKFQPMDGFPQAFPADRSFKNFRNVTLADLDNKPGQEILVGIANQLLVINQDSIFWQLTTSGIIRFPPSVGDVDGDGSLDVSAITGYNQGPGMAYLVDATGNSHPGWPKSFGGNTLVSATCLADLDRNGSLEILFGDAASGRGSLHVLSHDGLPLNGAWPIPFPNVPAITPTVADLDGNGSKEILLCTTREIYVLDGSGNLLPGWPYGNLLTKYSFQSPIAFELDDSRPGLEIVGAGHGDQPQYFAMYGDGIFLPGWPIAVPDHSWTFQPPTVIQYLDSTLILTGRPIGGEEDDMLFAYRPDGQLVSGFPIRKSGGLEGIITVGDLDGDAVPELAFSSNLLSESGHGLIHAYELDGSGELPGFPIAVYGWTFLNGATLGDVNGDELLDLVVLSYTEYLDEREDTAFVNVIELGVPVHEPSLLWPTYKGNNLHDGNLRLPTTTTSLSSGDAKTMIAPNPVSSDLRIIPSKNGIMTLYDITGQRVKEATITRHSLNILDLTAMPQGTYFAVFHHQGEIFENHKIMVLRD